MSAVRVGAVGVSDSDLIPLGPNCICIEKDKFESLAAPMFFRLAY